MNHKRAILAIVTLSAALLVPHSTYADVIVAWDWNDGTTQGWYASTSQSDEANAFRGNNVGNGSLQLFSPLLPAGTLTALSTVIFDLSILSYSTVASPSDLTFAHLALSPEHPAEPTRLWHLDLSNLAFGETRTFNLSIFDASGSGSLADPLFFNFLFADASFNVNTSAALLDNFIVSAAIPEPSTILLVSTGVLGLRVARRQLAVKTARPCQALLSTSTHRLI